MAKEKDKATVAIGEAVGVIAAQSIGEPGTQMCLSAEERILIKHEGVIHVVPIGEFTDSIMKTTGYRTIDSYEVADVDDEISVLALNEDEKLEWKKLVSCNRHANLKQLIKIKTASGRQIIATDFHSFAIRKNNKVTPIAGKELKKGDRIPSIKYLPENCLHSIQTESLLPVELHSNIIVREHSVSTPRSKTPLPETLQLDEHFGWLIGAYLSEGSLSNGEVCISNMDEDFLVRARNFSDALHLSYKEFKHHRGFAWGNDLRIRSTLLRNIIKNICGKGSSFKHVPDFAYSADEKFVAGLLRGYFDGDGNVSINRKMIRVSSNSEQLINGIKLLLTRLRIFAHKTKDKQCGLLIPCKYARTFFEKIGSDIKEKRIRLEKLAVEADKVTSKSQDYIDMISGFDDLLYKTAKKIRYPTRRVNNFTKRQKIGRATLLRYIQTFEKLAREKNIDINGELETMKRMYESDVVWDEIVEIAYVPPTSNYVYDLSVEGAHTFATFDGIITHNTMRTFHYAGVAEQVPTGLPRLIEIVDARREPKKPLMDIHLEKSAAKNEEKAAKIAEAIEEISLDSVAELEENFAKKQIVVTIDEKLLREEGLSLPDVKKMIKDVVGKEEIEEGESRSQLKIKMPGAKLRNIRRMTNKLAQLHLKGIKNIYRSMVIRGVDEYFIRTGGSNLEEIMKYPGVDATRVYTNDIKEVERVLGIEAARNAIIQEVKMVLDTQGLDVDLRHIMLLADAMTGDGTIKSVGRHGLSGGKAGILARAAFEETLKHLVAAAIKSDEDKLVGVTENIIIGQTIPVGTGLVRLEMKRK